MLGKFRIVQHSSCWSGRHRVLTSQLRTAKEVLRKVYVRSGTRKEHRQVGVVMVALSLISSLFLSQVLCLNFLHAVADRIPFHSLEGRMQSIIPVQPRP